MGFVFLGAILHTLLTSLRMWKIAKATRKLLQVVYVDEQRNVFSNLVFDNLAFLLNVVVAIYPNGHKYPKNE